MAGRGARAKRYAKRDLTKGVEVEFIQKLPDGGELLSCGHVGPDLPLNWHPPLRFGTILRRCKECRTDVPLFRPVSAAELSLVEESGMREFPPRLPGQSIFYPVCNPEYAMEIAERWNKKQLGKGYVLSFMIRADFISRYEKQRVGAKHHEEYWIPAEELEAFNKAIVGTIEIYRTYE